ncbi:HeH/LEM domain-containing protein [uncultured Clostridium sp.]|uniref:HeH/LEM domain-containing protein n=1 Tax=uncultured Clostridium sp. TaxID=59620 RepID=UPI0025D19B7C|nr:HeH/LEM domain-containing protein [uncultured Clostridium sp.]MDU4882989.1 HeH/LEM domain-containing protein [Clostridium celatum]MDU7076110.1 HeH/LEM domain-containing protein [Clostridium celatum]
MFKLRYLNIERIVESEYDRDKLLKEGYRLVAEKENNIEETSKEVLLENEDNNEVYSDLNDLTVEQLKEIATSKGIEFNSKIKKNELIDMIEERE